MVTSRGETSRRLENPLLPDIQPLPLQDLRTRFDFNVTQVDLRQTALFCLNYNVHRSARQHLQASKLRPPVVKEPSQPTVRLGTGSIARVSCRRAMFGMQYRGGRRGATMSYSLLLTVSRHPWTRRRRHECQLSSFSATHTDGCTCVVRHRNETPVPLGTEAMFAAN